LKDIDAHGRTVSQTETSCQMVEVPRVQLTQRESLTALLLASIGNRCRDNKNEPQIRDVP
jgi:hypothetical protein